MKLSKLKIWFDKHSVAILHSSAALLGLTVGFVLRYTTNPSPLVLSYIQLPGTLMIRYCSMFISPLIVVAVASSLGTIHTSTGGNNKRMIFVTLSLILGFTIVISTLGLVMVCLVEPGAGGGFSNNPDDRPQTARTTRSQEDSLHDVLMNLVPDNIISASFMMEHTALVPKDPQNKSMGYSKEKEHSFKINILGLCVFSLILGFVLLDLGDKVQTLRSILEEINTLIMKILRSFIIIMPIGMFFWMLDVAIKMKSPQAIVYNLFLFTLTAVIAFFIIWLLIYPSMYFLATRRNPFRLYRDAMPALVVAFGSGSSALTLPVTMKSMEDNHKLSKIVSNFVLPLAMNMHMPGTSVYYPMIVMFVAQMHGVVVPFVSMIPLAIYLILLVMALPAAAGGGLIFFVMACDIISVENPMNVLIYCIYIDWLLERMRTATNVMGDCVIAGIVQKYCGFEEIEDLEDVKLRQIITEDSSHAVVSSELSTHKL